MHAEVVGRIRPDVIRLPTGAASKRAKLVHGILVRIFSVDAFACRELERPADHPHSLAGATDEMHLDALELPVVDGTVLEARNVEVGAQLSIDPLEQVQVESCGDALGIVVRRLEPSPVLLEVGTDD